MSKKVSVKHIQIDKNQSTIIIVIAIATALTVFSLFATKALVAKGLYQRRALHARREIADKLKVNYSSAQTLFTQYKVYAQQDPNVLQGSASGNSSLDGDNARITLDALPSKYDAPALATSLEKILTSQNVTITSLSITDDPAGNSDKPVPNPQPKAISFSVAGATNYDGATQLLKKFESSIRPFDVTTLEISGTDKNMNLTLGMMTYFQPAKSLDLSATKEVK